MFRISKLILIAALVAAPAFADRNDRYEQNVDRTMTYRGGRIVIDHSFGAIDLRTTNGDTITLHAKIRSSDPDIGRQISVDISPATSSGVTIKTHYPDIHFHGSGSISYNRSNTGFRRCMCPAWRRRATIRLPKLSTRSPNSISL